MSPSFSTKNGVRYRFYVSSALLRGRKTEAGSVGRVPAAEIESAVLAALKSYRGQGESGNDPVGMLERVVVSCGQLLITTAGSSGTADIDGTPAEIGIAWSTTAKDSAAAVESEDAPDGAHNEGLVQSVVRAHAWAQSLRDGTYESVEMLAEANRLHPKVIRQALRLAFLSPNVTSVILAGSQPAALSLAQIPKLLPLPWTEHHRQLG
jgi:hypothetical protein